MSIPKELQSFRLKSTTPRRTILDIFHRAKTRHLSAEDVHRILLRQRVAVGFSTVYRVLTQFADAGILVRGLFARDRTVFELNDEDHHDHIVCLSCGRVEEFVSEDIERHQQQIAKKRKFILTDHSLSLYGFCSQCAKRKKARARKKA